MIGCWKCWNNSWIDSVIVLVYETNVIGPMLMIKYFSKLLNESIEEKNNSYGKIINVTSNLGSISRNDFGNYLSYRCSKAALNMLTKCAKYELPSVIIISLHPGWVDTDLGSHSGKKAPQTLEENIPKMVKVIENLNLEQSGIFCDYEGNEVPYWAYWKHPVISSTGKANQHIGSLIAFRMIDIHENELEDDII